jgi:hypothetical protein
MIGYRRRVGLHLRDFLTRAAYWVDVHTVEPYDPIRRTHEWVRNLTEEESQAFYRSLNENEDGFDLRLRGSVPEEWFRSMTAEAQEMGIYDTDAVDAYLDGKPCTHPSTWFDRTFCYCGCMHDYCEVCGKQMDPCAPVEALEECGS